MSEVTNIFKDGEITGFNPDIDGDHIKIGDYGRDHNYFQDKIAEALKYLSFFPDEDFFILYGGEVTDGGGGTIDVAAGAALGKNSDGEIRLIVIPELTGVSVPSGWNDGRQIWVIGEHEFKLGSSTRTHKTTSETYHYTLEDSYTGESDSDDLFVDSDPNSVSETIVCFGSFTMTGTTFAEVTGHRTREHKLYTPSHIDIYDQETFNNVIERVGANNYKIKDQYKSILFKNNNNVFYTYGSDSYLSGGDTWGYIETNNCISIEAENGAQLYAGDTLFYLEVNTDDCYLKNIWIKGLGSSAIALTESFKLNAYRVTYDNCKVSSRYSSSAMYGFYESATDAHNTTSKYINCSVFDLTTSHANKVIVGFSDETQNKKNCLEYNNDGTGNSRTIEDPPILWTQAELVGSGLAISNVGLTPSLAALNGTDVAFIDSANDELRCYRFNGSTWSLVGSGLAISTVGFCALAALNGTDVAFIDATNDELRCYRFNGSTWSLVGYGLVISSAGDPALAALNGTDVAFIDYTNDELRCYRFAYALQAPYRP